ncbi:hypothetical protein K438DRAFT_1749186 [Mycena galopus ATCC 62051]|nr:hypothetical protein K438DRAFT_1749186 [Mycena galopus ATCC 62051]
MRVILTQKVEEDLEHQFIKNLMDYDEPIEALNTIQDAARGGFDRVCPGTVANKSEEAGSIIRLGLFRYYNKERSQVHYSGNTTAPPSSYPLGSFITTYNFALLDGRRIVPTTRSKSQKPAESAIVQVRIAGHRYGGEIRNIFTHNQPGVLNSAQMVLVEMAWMKRSDHTPLSDPRFLWDDYSELGVETWELDDFEDPRTTGLPIVLPLNEIHCQLARGRLEHIDPPMWITATMDRFPTSLNAYGFGEATADANA